MSFEKVPEASWSGTSTKSGQILLIKLSAVNTGAISNDIADMMYVSLMSENILEIRDSACTVYD